MSWYECVAFCRWLSEISQEKILLPTDQQWQRAAQGDDNRAYPWGNEWDGTCCNHSVEAQYVGTTSVRHYEGIGDSPFGVVDLTGNVDEWCLTISHTGCTDLDGTDKRDLRGGSWSNSELDDFRVWFRDGSQPQSWYDDWGFRCVRSR